MAGKGDGEGEGSTLKLEGQITLIKYVMLFTNVLTWVSRYHFYTWRTSLFIVSIIRKSFNSITVLAKC